MFARIKQVLTAIAVVGAFVALAAQSGAVAQEKQSRVSGPAYTTPKDATKCIRDTAFMRRNHMKLLLHKRDKTMHDGIRTKDASLQQCINCHVTRDDAGKPIKVSNPKHFCAACHSYVAVKLDCFECHRSTPDTPAKSAGIPKIPAHSSLFASNSSQAKDLGKFLEGVSK